MKSGKLEDFLVLQRGFDITVSEQKSGVIPVVSSSGIKSFHSESKVKGPGVVIGRKGTLGKAFYLKSDFWPHDTTLWVKDFKGNDPMFCMYFLKSLALERFDVGASNPTLNRNHVHQIEVNFPDINQQKAIVEKISKFDELIETANKKIDSLEKCLFKYFRQIVAGSTKNVPLLEAVEIIEAGNRPKGGADSSGTIPSIGAENIIGMGKYNYDNEKYVSKDFFDRLKRGKIEDMDVLLYKDGAYIGRTSIFGSGFPHTIACLNEHVYRLRVNKDIGQVYFFCWLSQKETFQDIQKLNTNAAQPGLTKDKVLSLEIPVIDKNSLLIFNSDGEKIIRLAFVLAKQSRLLAIARDKLLFEFLQNRGLEQLKGVI